jgi:hypothetical protein
MNNITPAFIIDERDDWRTCDPSLWELEPIELEGDEKVIGHRYIDGAICKVLAKEGKLIALTKKI